MMVMASVGGGWMREGMKVTARAVDWAGGGRDGRSTSICFLLVEAEAEAEAERGMEEAYLYSRRSP